MDIDGITGKSYLARNTRIRRAVRCPYPNFPSAPRPGQDPGLLISDSVVPCEHVFGRAYDLRRHLLSEHSLAVEKVVVDAWVEDRWKSRSGLEGAGGQRGVTL